MTHALVTAGCAVHVAHINHGLRESASLDEKCAQELAQTLGVPFVSVTVDIEHRSNLEERAREARRAALMSLASNDAVIALAHTADDQAETVVLRLIRGTGLDGIAAMASPTAGIVRPLLHERRATLRAYCAVHHLAFADDPMNEDQRFQRVRVRNEVMPLLSEIAQRDVVPVIARFGELAASQRSAVSEILAHVPRSLTEPFPLAGIEQLTNAALAELLRAWWGLPSLDRDALGRVIEVARNAVLATEVSGGERVERQNGSLHRRPRAD